MKPSLLMNHWKRYTLPRALLKVNLFALLLLSTFIDAKAAKTSFNLSTHATTSIIKGKVIDEKNEGIPGVNILIKGTQRGTSTDVNGEFAIDITGQDTVLVFSSVGYISQEVAISSENPLNVVLENDEKALEELVVVGYGVQKKSSVTGAVSVITSKTLEDRPVTNTLAALQGAAPGLVITRSTGQPGKENWSAQIRNFTSVNGSSPLILVDGVEQANIGSLNQNDIENVSVLKDASVAAIYGARAAGGVILITTKKGKSGKLTVSYNGLYSVNKPFNMPKRLHSWQEATMQNEAAVNAGGTPVFRDDEIAMLKDPNINFVINPANTSAYIYYDDNNAIDSVARKTTSQQQHNVSVNGGNDITQYLISLGYYTQNGLFKFGPDDYDRYNFRLNLTTKFTKWLSLDSRIGYTNQQVLSPMAEVNGDYGLLYNIYSLRQFAPIHLPGFPDRYNDYSSTNQTYAYLKDGGRTKERTDHFNGVFTLQSADIIKGLNLRAIFAPYLQGGSYNRSIRTIPRYNIAGISGYYNNPNSYTVQNSNVFRSNYQFLADYSLQLGSKNNLQVLGGYQFEKFRSTSSTATAKNLSSNELFSLNLGDPTLYAASDNINTWAMESVFGRLSYNYADKYFLEGVVRYDGSSKLAPGYRYNAFPSISAAWRLSQESWFNSILPVFGEFKLRASVGKLGNSDLNNFGSYDYISSLTKSAAYPLNNVTTYGYYNGSLASPQKTWEKITTSNIGLDISMLKNRLTLGADYYIKKNQNMLVTVNTTTMIGISTGQYNYASMKAWGWEINAGWRDKIGDHFNYYVNGNISDSKNRVEKYQGASVYSEGTRSVIEGEELNTIWGYQAQGLYGSKEQVNERGVFQSNVTGPGDIIYKDIDGSGRIDGGTNTRENHGDLVKLGSTTPRYTYGFNAGFNVKGFDFSFLFQGVGKRSMLINSYFMLPFRESWRQPVQGQDDYWTPENTDAKFPRLFLGGGQNASTSSWWVQKASYIRLKNLQVGYTLPTAISQKAKMSAVRFYLSGQDLWEKSSMWLNYYDPEEPNNTAFNYPFFRSYAIGLNVTF
jgi:TonB-linked SusC/RagA family outer membrane protein